MTIRYLVKGNQFWSITRIDDKTFDVREGELGAKKIEAKRVAYRTWTKSTENWSKRVAEKAAAGYKPPRTKEAIAPTLEAALATNPADVESFAVYADWLQTQDHPRGQLAAVQNAIAKLAPGKPENEYYFRPPALRRSWPVRSKAAGSKKLYGEQARLFVEHGLDPRNRELLALDDSHYYRCDVDWRSGFVHAVRFRLSGSGLETLDAVTEFIAHPSSRFLYALVLAELFDDGFGDKALKAIAKVTPATVRFLHIGDFSIGSPEISWVDVGNVSPFYAACPQLETLIVQGAAIEFGKQIALPQLRHLEVRTGGLRKTAAKAIAGSSLPALETLSVWFGEKEYGSTATLADVQPILDGKGLPKLRHLALANTALGLGNEIAAAVVGAKITKQLRSLDLSMGSLDDDGAQILADAKKSLGHLETLDVSECYLTAKGIALVKKLAKHVTVDKQREPYDWDEEKRRYARIGE